MRHVVICDIENLYYLTRNHKYHIHINKLNNWLSNHGATERLAIGSRNPSLETWAQQFSETGWEVRLAPNKRNFPSSELRSNADAAICLEIGALIHEEGLKSITIITCDFALLVDVAWHITEVDQLDIQLSVLAYPKFKAGLLPTDIKGIASYTRLDEVLAQD